MGNFSELSQFTSWTNSPWGYILMFAAMVLWGPPVTSTGAFAAALGYFNGWVVFAISILSSLLADVVHYAIGFWGRGGFIEKYGKYVGLTPKLVSRLDKLMHKNAGKAVILSKIIPLFAAPALIIAGATRTPLKKYVWWCFVVTVPTSILFFVIGYYFGEAYITIESYINSGGFLLALLAIVFVVGIFAWKKISSVIFKDTR